jgi:preprotein translocase subunit SecF
MNLNLHKQRSIWWILSCVLIGMSLIAMALSWQQFQSPLRPGLDFVGGSRLQLERDCTQPNACQQPIDIGVVRGVLARQGLGNSSIQLLGEQQVISMRTPPLSGDQRTQLQADLAAEIGTFDPKKTQIDTVGPTLGRQLLNSGLLALALSCGGIIVYLSVRFRLDYGFFAIVALVHDVLITLGVFAALGLVQGVEVDSLFIVALLTTVGFSVNDTVVIYDRVRETLALNPDDPIGEVVNTAVNQTLGRSINTTLTALLPLLAIFLLGGETLKYFALALIVGFTAGAYSSIFIASTLLMWWRERSGAGNLSDSTLAGSAQTLPSPHPDDL